MSSLERPPAAVRMMTPPVKPCSSRKSRTMPRRRARSSRDSILRDTPTWSTVGMKTRKRPGIVTCDVSRAPFVPSGSLTTWTRTSCPSFSRSSILAWGLSSREWPRPDPEPTARTARGARRGRPLPPSATGAVPGRARLDARRSPGAARENRDLVLVAGLEPVELLDGVDDLGDVEERVALEADINEGGLHAGQHLRDPALVDIADHAALTLALDEDLDDLIVFEDRDTRVVVARGDDHLLVHWNSRQWWNPARARADACTVARARQQPGQPAHEDATRSCDHHAESANHDCRIRGSGNRLIRKPPHPHVEDQAERRERRDHRRAAVAHERQREALDGRQAGRHRDVVNHLEREARR